MADIRFLVEDIDDADDDQDDGCEMEQDDPSVLDQITPEELLSPIIRMEKYMHSDVIFNRQMAARYTREALKACKTKEDIYHVLRLVVRLSEDIEPCVRVELIEQIPHVALFCYEHYSMMEAVPQYILYIVLRYLMDSNNQVRKSSQQVLLELLEHELVERADIEEQVCPVLMQLTAGDSSDDYRSEAVTLMSKMAPLIGKDITEQFFMPRFEMLCSDPLFHVRKVCASSFGDMCNVVGPDATTDKLLPVFFRLCQDGVWGVRKSCAETFMSVSAASPEIVRGSDLAEVFISLLCDKSRWVQMAAYQNLGPFISTFADPNKSGFYINDYGQLCPVPRIEEARTEAEPTTYENTGTNEPTENSSTEKDPETRERGSSPEANTVDSGYISPPDLPAETTDTPKATCQSNGCSEDSTSGCKSIQTTDLDDDVDENYFNAFLFWRNPLPQVEIELDDIGSDKEGNKKEVKEEDESQDSAENIPSENDSFQEDSNVSGENNSSSPVDSDDSDETPSNSPRLIFQHDSEEEHMPIFSLTDDHPDFDYDDYHDMKLRHSSSFDEDLLLSNHMAMPHQDVIPQALLDHYVSMTEPSKAQTIDTEIARHCAFSFPAVTLTLGRCNWPCLRDTYELLSSDMQWKVRRTLAFSIHELAQVLGEEMTKIELVPTFNSFLKDLDEVRIGVLKHLADFIKLLPLDIRVDYLPVLVDFLSTDNNRNWRFRQELAEQLMYLSELYSPPYVQQFVCPIAITLATDRVADVRTIAFRLIGVLLRRLHGCKDDCSVRKFVSDIIIKFAHSQQWTRRQAYAQLCQNMLEENAESGPHFCQEFLPNLLSMLSDKVPNVRLAVARTLTHSVLTCDYLTQPECKEKDIVTAALSKLQSDADRDVRYFAGSKEDFDEYHRDEYHRDEYERDEYERDAEYQREEEEYQTRQSMEHSTEDDDDSHDYYNEDNTEHLDMEEEEERTGDFKTEEEEQTAHLENEIAEELNREFQDNQNMILEDSTKEGISIGDKDDVSGSNLEEEGCGNSGSSDEEACAQEGVVITEGGDAGSAPDTSAEVASSEESDESES